MIRRSLIILLGGLTTGGCASAPAQAPHDRIAGPDSCVILPSGSGPDTVSIALPHQLEPYRLDAPGHDGAAMLFAAVQETLVETDCHGRPMPALASRWSSDASGRIWSFTLRQDAVFTDGTPLDAQGVAAAWVESDEWAAPGVIRARTHIRHVEVRGAYELTVELDEPADVTFFADPSLGVRRYVDSWPVGTGPYEIVRPDRSWNRAESLVTLRLSDAAASGRPDLPQELRFLGMESSDDLRVALDEGIDVIVSRESAVLDYARILGGYEFTPLPWDMTLYLFAPAATANVPVPDSALAALARDAVEGDAIAAPPLDIEEGADGASANRPPGPAAVSPRIVYYEDPEIGRGLAERLVALAAREERAPWLDARLPRGVLRAEGLTIEEFNLSFMDGREAGYIVPLGKHQQRMFLEGTISRFGGGPPAALFTPLVMTRPTVIHRPWLGPMRIDANGTLRFGLPRTPRQH